MDREPVLVLITKNYPYVANGGEVMFVQPEVLRLTKIFNRIVVVPCMPTGDLVCEIGSIDVDTSLGQQFLNSRFSALKALFLELITLRFNLAVTEIVGATLKWGRDGFFRALSWSAQAAAVKRWARKSLKKYPGGVLYTYWNTEVTVGLVSEMSGADKWTLATRVHGYDLYEERSTPQYIPYRSYVLSKIDRIFPISLAGRNYLLNKKVSSSKLKLAYLGIEDPGFLCSKSQRDVLHIVSCSFIVSVKRVPFVAQCIIEFAKRNPSVKIKWTHLGGGVDSGKVSAVVVSPPQNIEIALCGLVSNSEVFDFYKKNCVDVFIHLSSSEGLPVSMMEASAVGVPIIATDVGGVSEIVGKENGWLLPANPSENEVVEVLTAFLRESDGERVQRRHAARKVWESNFNADVNHKTFGSELKILFQGDRGFER